MKNIISKLSIALLAVVMITVVSCQKSAIEPENETVMIENSAKETEPIYATISTFCSDRPTGICSDAILSGTGHNSIHVQLNSSTCNYYTTLNYKIYKVGTPNLLVYDCTSSTSPSCGKDIAPNGGLSNNTQYEVVLTNPSGTQTYSYTITTGDCIER